MAQVTFDTVELENFVKRLGKAAQGDFKRALNKFLEGLGMEFLRILQDEIVRRNVLDYRLLLHSFQKGDGENVWTLDENGLTLEVGTNVEYAKFVNDGHWTNPERDREAIRSRTLGKSERKGPLHLHPGRKDRDGPKNEMGGGLPLLGKLHQNPRKALPGAARKEAAELAGRVFQGFFVR